MHLVCQVEEKDGVWHMGLAYVCGIWLWHIRQMRLRDASDGCVRRMSATDACDMCGEELDWCGREILASLKKTVGESGRDFVFLGLFSSIHPVVYI